jgi:hypothetical protein
MAFDGAKLSGSETLTGFERRKKMEAKHVNKAQSVTLVLFLFLMLLLWPATGASAFPAAKFDETTKVCSFQRADGVVITLFFAIISGPSPIDVASFTATGPSGTFPLAPGIPPNRQYGFHYIGVYSGIAASGRYTFEIQDTQGRSTKLIRDFTYEALPCVDSGGMVPANYSYVGTTTPTLSFNPAPGANFYQVVVTDYDEKATWYHTLVTSSTSLTIPSGVLQPNTAYRWWARVWDSPSHPQNYRSSDPFCFYTGAKGSPQIDASGLITLPYSGNLLNFGWARAANVAPWDIDHFTATGPGSLLVSLAERRDYGFQMPAYNAKALFLDPPTQSVPDGTYTVEIEDKSGNKYVVTTDYAYRPVPEFAADTRVPVDNAYLDTATPTFTWSRVAGDPGDGSYRYSIRIVDNNSGEFRWYDAPFGPDTSFTLPNGLDLPRGTSYKWRVNVYGPAAPGGTNENNYRCSDLRTFTIDEPGTDIKANGQDEALTVPSGTSVSITVGLTPAEYAGFNADWWIAVHTPFAPPGDWYTYVHPTGWRAGVHRCVQMPLFQLSDTEVLNMALPAGNYTFYFAVDPPDGIPTAELLDSVAVAVTP